MKSFSLEKEIFVIWCCALCLRWTNDRCRSLSRLQFLPIIHRKFWSFENICILCNRLRFLNEQNLFLFRRKSTLCWSVNSLLWNTRKITIRKVIIYRRFESHLTWIILTLFEDETQFRQLVVWLEDMKIRLYPIDGRQNLRDIQNPQWEQTLIQVGHDDAFSLNLR